MRDGHARGPGPTRRLQGAQTPGWARRLIREFGQLRRTRDARRRPDARDGAPGRWLARAGERLDGPSSPRCTGFRPVSSPDRKDSRLPVSKDDRTTTPRRQPCFGVFCAGGSRQRARASRRPAAYVEPLSAAWAITGASTLSRAPLQAAERDTRERRRGDNSRDCRQRVAIGSRRFARRPDASRSTRSWAARAKSEDGRGRGDRGAP